jgi:hypothetical protein
MCTALLRRTLRERQMDWHESETSPTLVTTESRGDTAMLRKSMVKVALLLVVGIGTIGVGLARSAPIASQDEPDAQANIENAMSAAPSSIAENATILDNALDEAGKFVVLREGSNGWSCFPDVPTTPGNDPMCADKTWLEWNYAYVAGEEPNTTVPGFAYMLQGGSDASNTDPLATEPAAGEEWVSSPPHIMVLMPGDLDQGAFSTDHASGEPYIMWAGTPYEHIMVPVAEGEHEM